MIHGSSASVAPVAPAGPDRLGRKRAVRAEGILDRAMEIVAESGVEALTLQRVASSLGYVPAALYRYFDSKDALLAALQRRAVAAIHEAFRADQAAWTARAEGLGAGGMVLGGLLAAARFYLRLPQSDPRSWGLVAVLLGDPRELLSEEEARKTAPLLLSLLAEVQALFDRAAEAGALSPGDGMERTLALWSALQGALVLAKGRRIMTALPGPLDVGMVATRAMLVGWGADATVVAGAERAPAGGGRRGRPRKGER